MVDDPEVLDGERIGRARGVGKGISPPYWGWTPGECGWAALPILR